ncbi:MAG: hypothetical protein RLZZ28_1519 [Bacteroidota bacterium]|jgi:hypothetical protein
MGWMAFWRVLAPKWLKEAFPHCLNSGKLFYITKAPLLRADIWLCFNRLVFDGSYARQYFSFEIFE